MKNQSAVQQALNKSFTLLTNEEGDFPKKSNESIHLFDLLEGDTDIIYTSTYKTILSSLFLVCENLKPLKPNPKQKKWFSESLKKIEEILKQSTLHLTEEGQTHFHEVIHEALVIIKQIQALELSLCVNQYTQTAYNDLREVPPNLCDFYSAVALFNNYLEVIPRNQQPLVENLVQTLSLMKIGPKEHFDKLHELSLQLASFIAILCNPLTSPQICDDISCEAQDLFKKASSLFNKVPLKNIFTKMEILEIERVKKLAKAPVNDTYFITLFSGFESPIMTLRALKKYHDRTFATYRLYSCLLCALNTLRDFSTKLPKEEFSHLIDDFSEMCKNFILFLEICPKDQFVEKQSRHLAERAIEDFKQHYRDIISTTKHLNTKIQ